MAFIAASLKRWETSDVGCISCVASLSERTSVVGNEHMPWQNYKSATVTESPSHHKTPTSPPTCSILDPKPSHLYISRIFTFLGHVRNLSLSLVSYTSSYPSVSDGKQPSSSPIPLFSSGFSPWNDVVVKEQVAEVFSPGACHSRSQDFLPRASAGRLAERNYHTLSHTRAWKP